MARLKSVSWVARLTIFFGMSANLMAIVFIARITVDTGTRMVYPFIPQLSEGLGLSILGFSWLIFIRAMAGMTGPIFGVLADRFGRRRIMTFGLLSQAVGVIALTLSQQWWSTGPMILFGLCLAGFIPAGQAYISDRVTYARRGRALASIEFSWALVGIINLPIIGWLIDNFGWRSAFYVVAIFSLLGAILVWTQLPAVESRSQTKLNFSQIITIVQRPSVLASMGVALMLFVGVGSFATIWSIWLSADFRLTAIALGLVATTIGVAELGGSGISSLFIDRFGKKRGSQAGLLLITAAFILLPLTQFDLLLAVVGLFVLGLLIEFTVVSLIPLYSEQAPEARATAFSLIAMGASVGIATGSPLAAWLWGRFGLWGVCLAIAVCTLIALGLVTQCLYDEAS